MPKHRPVEEPPHLPLVGGPGQGKTTLTALLAQLYRVALLQEAPNLGREAEPMHADLVRDLPAAGLPRPAKPALAYPD